MNKVKGTRALKEKKQELEQVTHRFEPVYDERSQVLILGTFPSVKSRENQFYYGHPQNRFWKVISAVTGEELPVTIPEKKAMLMRQHIAIWDVIASCEIRGSSDSSIQNVVANPIEHLLKQSSIGRIYGNGDKACKLYQKYCLEKTKVAIHKLPSTSPANAAFSLDELIRQWGGALRERERDTE